MIWHGGEKPCPRMVVARRRAFVLEDKMSAKKEWIIRGRDRAGVAYWSNQDGWVDRKSATVFSGSEKKRFRLPSYTGIPRNPGVKWVSRQGAW